MTDKNIKTLISSGTVIFAVVLYLIFNNNSPKEEPTSDYFITPVYATEATGNDLVEAEYVSTNDGDTFRVRMDGKEQPVRLLMVDTPEMNYDENDPMPYAEDAKEFTQQLLENASKIELLFDVGPQTDNYDRLLTYVFVDGVLLQEALVKEGFAAVRYIYEPNNTLEEEFRKVEEKAKEEKINIWSYDGYFQQNGFHPDVVQ